MRLTLVIASLLFTAACGKKEPAPADGESGTPKADTASIIDASGPKPEPSREPAAIDTSVYLVWSETERGPVTSWVSADADGIRIEASRPQVVVFADETLFGLELRFTAFTETSCEDFENGKKTRSGKRWLPHLAARGLAGRDIDQVRELTRPRSGYVADDGAAEEPFEIVGEHWGRTHTVTGSWRDLVLVTECEGSYGCGAHGDTSCQAKAIELGPDAVSFDPEQVAKHVAADAKTTLTGWESDGDVLEPTLDHVRLKSNNGEVEVDYVYTAGVPYSGTDGTWSSYSQSRTYTGKAVESLALGELPAVVKKALQKTSAAGHFGWSIVKPTSLEEARRAFDDPTTLPSPAPTDEVVAAPASDSRQLLEQGRKLTRDKDYPGAIAAFDKAIDADPKLARAWSGRGYAKLLAGDLDLAKADLDHALTLDQSKKLQAAVHFNLGEIAEKKGDKVLARDHYERANGLVPTDASKKRLEALSAP
jgi:hypothetical protein